jgi:hypothetical protein
MAVDEGVPPSPACTWCKSIQDDYNETACGTQRVPTDFQHFTHPPHRREGALRHGRASLIRMLLMLLLGCAAPLAMAETNEREQKIRAAYLYHLAQFIDWPDTHALKTSRHITICSTIASGFASYLQNLTQRKAKGREIRLQEVDKGSMTDSCNILFLESANDVAPPLLEQYASNGTITVGNHVRLMINFDKAKASGLYISANLLEVATLVTPSNPGIKASEGR